MPQLVILAGPYGAGKSTLAARFIPPGVPFLNADNIARTLATSRVLWLLRPDKMQTLPPGVFCWRGKTSRFRQKSASL